MSYRDQQQQQQQSVFYGGGSQANNNNNNNNMIQASPYQQQHNINKIQYSQHQQQQMIGNPDMRQDINSLMDGLGQEAQIKMQQQLAQLVINKVYKSDEEKKKKQQDANNIAGDTDPENESCPSLLFHRCCFFLDVEFYKPYFKFVTTQAVVKRIGHSLIPFKADFFSIADNHPDLYGPLWIAFTLVFALTAAGNLSQYIQSPDQSHFSYKFSYVSSAFSMVFGYVSIVPIFIAFMMKLFGSTHTFYLQTICIYGYSLFVFIPISLLCIIPYNLAQYCLFLYAAINSTFFLLNNFLSKLNELKTGDGQMDRKRIVIGMIAGIQILSMFLYKYYFFKQMYYTQSSDLIDNNQDMPFLQNQSLNSHNHNQNQMNQFNNNTDLYNHQYKTIGHHSNHNLHLLI